MNIQQLRRALQQRPEILEAIEAGERKVSGRPGVNVAAMWQMTMRALYASADVPVLGTREALQNAIDAVRAAIKAREIRKGEGQFEVRWDGKARQIDWLDNGIGMSADDILTKFLVLGSSGKAAASDSDEAAGGFGVAKAVILGTSSTFRWRMHTRDNLAVSDGLDGEVDVFAAAWRQGTHISAFDVSTDYDHWWDNAGGGSQPLEARLLELLSANDLPELTLTYNGQPVRPRFNRRGGSKIEVIGSWGNGTTARVKAHKRSDRRGAYWVRLNGLFQFKAGSRGDLGVDVVLDLLTTVRPGELGYPLNAGRDSLQGAARHAFQTLIEEVERENLSIGKAEEDEVFEAEGELEDALTEDVHAMTRDLLDDPKLAQVLTEAGIAAPTEASPDQGGAGNREGSSGDDSTTSAAQDAVAGIEPNPDSFGQPGAYRRASGSASEQAPQMPVLRTELPDDHLLDLSDFGGGFPWFPAGLRTADAIRTALERAAEESPYELSAQIISALIAVEEEQEITVAQLRLIAEAMDEAARRVALARGLEDPRVDAVQRKTRKRPGNPFGPLGALRISRTDYDKKRARAFKRNPKRWIGPLLLWDTTLKLMAVAGEIRRAIRPGFVLENGLIGLAERRRESSSVTVYLNPERLMEVAQENRENPLAIAGFLHSVAAHELTHADGRMGTGHSQAFVSAREDLGHRTAQLLPQLATLATKLLKLPEPKDENAALASRLEKQLRKARAARDRLRKEHRALSRRHGRQEADRDTLLGQLDAAEERIHSLEHRLEGCQAAMKALRKEYASELDSSCPTCAPERAIHPQRVVVPPLASTSAADDSLATSTDDSLAPAADASLTSATDDSLAPAADDSLTSATDDSLAPAAGDSSSMAAAVLNAARAFLHQNLPHGLEPGDVEAFFGRHEVHLLQLVAARLGDDGGQRIAERFLSTSTLSGGERP